MGMYCDLHGIERDVHIQVNVCHGVGYDRRDRPYLAVKVTVGDGRVMLFLRPDQALDLAQGLTSAVQEADVGGEATAQAITDQGGAL